MCVYIYIHTHTYWPLSSSRLGPLAHCSARLSVAWRSWYVPISSAPCAFVTYDSFSSWKMTHWVRDIRWLIQRCPTQLIRAHIIGALWVRDRWLPEFVEDDSLSWWPLSVARRSWYVFISSAPYEFVTNESLSSWKTTHWVGDVEMTHWVLLDAADMYRRCSVGSWKITN